MSPETWHVWHGHGSPSTKHARRLEQKPVRSARSESAQHVTRLTAVRSRADGPACGPVGPRGNKATSHDMLTGTLQAAERGDTLRKEQLVRFLDRLWGGNVHFSVERFIYSSARLKNGEKAFQKTEKNADTGASHQQRLFGSAAAGRRSLRSEGTNAAAASCTVGEASNPV